MGNKKFALSQIFLLVVGVVAFSYAIGSEVGVVSARDPRMGDSYSSNGVNYYFGIDGNWHSGPNGQIAPNSLAIDNAFRTATVNEAGRANVAATATANEIARANQAAAAAQVGANPADVPVPATVTSSTLQNPLNSQSITGTVPEIRFSAKGEKIFTGVKGTSEGPICSDCTYDLKENGEELYPTWHKYGADGVEQKLNPTQEAQLNGAYCTKYPGNCVDVEEGAGTTLTPGPTDTGTTRAGENFFGTGEPGNEGFIEPKVVVEKQPVSPLTGCEDYGAGWILSGSDCVPSQQACTGTNFLWEGETCYELSCGAGTSLVGGECIETITGKPSDFLGYIGKGLQYALMFKLGATLLGPVLGLGASQTEAIGNAGALGIFTANVAEGALKEAAENSYSWAPTTAEGAATAGNWVGVGVAAYYFLKEYKEEGTVTTSFSCVPWQPPLSGKNCERCNNGFLPCSEYQCKSLGQACELVNKGTSEESCVWVSKNDVSPPTIEALESALLNDDYRYTPDDAILPPDRGVRVDYLTSTQGDNCVPAFTPLKIGVQLDEPAKCKIDTLRKNDFKTMEIEMSSGLLQYNHTFSLSLPGTANSEAEGIDLANDGEYSLFVRCEDANGNANIGTFVFNYCVDKGPDTTPPLIVATEVPNNFPIAYNQSVLDLQVYINEPAECRWSHTNMDYATMCSKDELDCKNQMDCQTTIGSTNAQGLYTCNANLTGLKDRFTNTFYFRCQDKSSTPNENVESFIYNVIGTQALVITSASPNDTTIKDSTSVVKVSFNVKTTAGYKDGESSCEYSDTGITDDYVKFFTTDSSSHKQDLFLPEGTYDYFIRCRDLGGNTDIERINFTTESDNEAPVVVRAYHEEQYLKIQTAEEAKCVYDVVDCTYDVKDGTPMTSVDGTGHFTNWDIKSNVYVKCEDTYGNQPLPNACSIIVKSTTF
ncbi:MAG: hypothetical protein AABX93_01435 [Nanoarchaeota archaeon]